MLNRLHIRSKSQSSVFDQPIEVTASATNQPSLPRSGLASRAQQLRPKFNARSLLATPDVPDISVQNEEITPREMMPVLTLLASHGSRVYIEGYFMLLAELNSEGHPIPDRKWVEVFGTLQGTVVTMWDAAKLDQGQYDTSFINVSDGYMRSIDTLGPDLQNIIVLSTTMKNRYLLQFGTKKLFNEWTAALRLALFERTALQEAYTGALLSSKGSQLHGIRAMLAEAKYKTETWCHVRFGVGMPWKRVWAIITPNVALKDKKERKRREPLGKIELFGDPRDVKKKREPLATLHRASAAFAVFPEKAVLVNVSSLIKMECFVEFAGDQEVRESAVFIMPEQHPGIQGFETLIRFIIPVFDVFSLYGRPRRLNADKNDINSLLFGMPTLPRAYYLDVIDVFMLATLPESQSWSASEWNLKLKELIARKMSLGSKGTGNIHQVVSGGTRSSTSSSSNRNSMLTAPINAQMSASSKQRAVSEPNSIPKLFGNSRMSLKDDSTTSLASTQSKHAPNVPSPLQHSRPAPKAPPSKPLQTQQSTPSKLGLVATPSGGSTYTNPGTLYPYESRSSSSTGLEASTAALGLGAYAASRDPAGNPETASDNLLGIPGSAPRGPRPPPSATKTHERTQSDGGSRIPGLLTPTLDSTSQLGSPAQPSPSVEKRDRAGYLEPPSTTPKRSSHLTVTSMESYESAEEGLGDANPRIGAQASPRSNKSAVESAGGSANLFDPTFRPAHQSYADYSEYMHQYLNRKSASTSPTRGESPNTFKDKDDDDFDLPMSSTAKLLDTPIRTPEFSLSTVSPAASTQQDSVLPSPTAEAGARVGPYPNAPGSPANRRSVVLPPPPGVVGEGTQERRPSGPRPEPSKAEYSAGYFSSSGESATVKKPLARKPVAQDGSQDELDNKDWFSSPPKPSGKAADDFDRRHETVTSDPYRPSTGTSAPSSAMSGYPPDPLSAPSPAHGGYASGGALPMPADIQGGIPRPVSPSSRGFSPYGSPSRYNGGAARGYASSGSDGGSPMRAPPPSQSNGGQAYNAHPGMFGSQMGLPHNGGMPTGMHAAPTPAYTQQPARSGSPYGMPSPQGGAQPPQHPGVVGGPRPAPGQMKMPPAGLRGPAHPNPYQMPGMQPGGPSPGANPYAPPPAGGNMGQGMPGWGGHQPPPPQNMMPGHPGPASSMQGSAKTGPVLRPLNEIRAQQLRSTRQHANNGGYPSFR